MTGPLLLCLEFEASGCDPRGYPIEAAIADVATGETREWLIAPTPAWLETGAWEFAKQKPNKPATFSGLISRGFGQEACA